ncbi:hypothetical protein BH11BAC7_BH11BAC7_05560 [soil metagenome]
MKTTLVLFFALFLVITANAQTKRIALLSHSGKISSLKMKSESNFGATPEMMKDYARRMDSIFLADSTRISDSLLRLKQNPKQGTGAKYIDTDKPQFMPQKPDPARAGSWLGKARFK